MIARRKADPYAVDTSNGVALELQYPTIAVQIVEALWQIVEDPSPGSPPQSDWDLMPKSLPDLKREPRF